MREVARFADSDVAYIVDLLRTVYRTVDIADCYEGGVDSNGKLFLGDFIEALDTCDSIEIVTDEEFLVDED